MQVEIGATAICLLFLTWMMMIGLTKSKPIPSRISMITKVTKNHSVSIKRDIISLREEPSNNDEARRESSRRVEAG